MLGQICTDVIFSVYLPLARVVKSYVWTHRKDLANGRSEKITGGSSLYSSLEMGNRL